MSFGQHLSATSLAASLDSIAKPDHSRTVSPLSLDSATPINRAAIYQPFAAIERRSAPQMAPTSHLFSVRSALLPKSAHLTENTEQTHIYKYISFNELRIAISYISRKSFANIILQIGYRGVRGSRLAHEISIIANSPKSPAITDFSRPTARYDTMTPSNKFPGAIRATA
jgi:hypothetical protein